nr:antibiotic biosynthesis monooxygenase [Saprospiraceae bacterium]
MITRIVKLNISPDREDSFLSLFNSSKLRIRGFEGCSGLKLYRDQRYSNIFFTYSLWETSEHLNQYRNSDLFQTTWRETKKLFADRPRAWSLHLIDDISPKNNLE